LNDSKLFGRLREGASVTTATLEKFASFFADSSNWKDGVIPQEVATFVGIVGTSQKMRAASPDNAPDIIGSDRPCFPEGEPSGRAPAVYSPPGSAAGVTISGVASIGEVA
jgi:hypothetical protein